MPLLLGLTGNIACGKTTVGQMTLEMGAASYIDADAVVHDLYAPGQAIHAAVLAAFGEAVRAPDGTIDRRALGTIVFNDPGKLRQLESIVHPAVHTAIIAQLSGLESRDVAIIDAVKLLEGGMAAWCAAVWLVICSPEEERRRLIADRGMTPAEAEARLSAQPDRTAQRDLVTTVIDNSGSLAATRAQVEIAWQDFQRLFPWTSPQLLL